GAFQVSVADPVATASTVMLNGPSHATSSRSETLIRISDQVRTSPAPGVPDNRPVDSSKSAHSGAFTMSNVSVSPSASRAVGLKRYCSPTCTVLGGVPVIVGRVFAGGGSSGGGSSGGGSCGGGSSGGGSSGGGSSGGGSSGGGSSGGGCCGGGSSGGGSSGGDGVVTRIENGGSVVVAWPSLTEITMFRYLPASAFVGTPSSVPVASSNDAQLGRFRIPKESESPSASSACGTNR